MGMNFYAIGGYNEVGRNMCALEVDDEIVILDIGLYIPAVVAYEEVQEKFSAEEMQRIKAIPDDIILKDKRDKVKAVVFGHPHLDHIGGAAYLLSHYRKAKVIGTPYTIKVLDKIAKDKGKRISNRIIRLKDGGRVKVSKNISIEFLNVTHSTLGCVIVVVHTPYGAVVYSLDFKLDDTPVLSKKTNYKRLKSLGNVNTLVLDSLYSNEAVKTPSEKVARELLREVLLERDNKGKGIIVTTFSSHLARLKSIIDYGHLLRRKIVFLGRSLNRYVRAAEEVGLIKFSDRVEIVAYGNAIKRKLKQIEKEGSEKYLIVCTGNQGEPGSVLVKMSTGVHPFKFKYDDHVIFCCRTIPTEENIKNREKLENRFKRIGCRIFTEIHVSGHGGREDERDLIEMVKPKNIIPAHGGRSVVKGAEELAKEMGYKPGKNVHILRNGQKLKLV